MSPFVKCVHICVLVLVNACSHSFSYVYKYIWLFTVRCTNCPKFIRSISLCMCAIFLSFFVLSFRFIRQYSTFFWFVHSFLLSLKLNYRNYSRLGDLIYICKNIKWNTDHDYYATYCMEFGKAKEELIRNGKYIRSNLVDSRFAFVR